MAPCTSRERHMKKQHLKVKQTDSEQGMFGFFSKSMRLFSLWNKLPRARVISLVPENFITTECLSEDRLKTWKKLCGSLQPMSVQMLFFIFSSLKIIMKKSTCFLGIYSSLFQRCKMQVLPFDRLSKFFRSSFQTRKKTNPTGFLSTRYCLLMEQTPLSLE